MKIREFLERFTADELSEIISICTSIISNKEKEYPLSVRKSNISTRLLNILYNYYSKIEYWDELNNYTITQVYNFRNMGKATMTELKKELTKRNIQFKSEL